MHILVQRYSKLSAWQIPLEGLLNPDYSVPANPGLPDFWFCWIEEGLEILHFWFDLKLLSYWHRDHTQLPLRLLISRPCQVTTG